MPIVYSTPVATEGLRGNDKQQIWEMMTMNNCCIRFSADGSVSMVWADGEAVRVPTQMDLDILPVGDDMTDDEVAGLDG